ncbi:hypothetical protein P3X46_002802 [Hevea brasiliensis]|uniref:Uncharacterized protein n=1 Tax=Hevea brasiliensis TaxID=3981 RepID=A0ABQ9N451_HEVBR|nr:tetraspanin-11-like [Hevea brasiliensis]KAJ9187336.1 hypothetical protein P3X46_002802 [Hevea brasiliensis]
MAAGISNTIIAMINFITLIFGLIAVCTGIYLFAHGGTTHCQKLIQTPITIMGLFVMVVSFLGLMGSCYRDNSVLITYLVVIFFLIVGIIAFTIFVFFVTHEGAGNAVSGLGFKEYRLQDFSKFFQKHTFDYKNWDRFKSCLVDAHFCQSLILSADHNESDFYKMKLSPLQSGCCKPPTSCKLEYKEPTVWMMPKSGPAVNDTDCSTWNNGQDLLCYDCNSCKGGFLANLREEYRILLAYNILTIAFLILVYFIGCCARRSNKYRYVKYSPYVNV